MSLLVTKSGVLDTIQDCGRYGYGKWGVNPCGAMDRYAAQIANALAGNKLKDAVIEMHFPAMEVVFHQDALISLTGADLTPYINTREVPLWKSIVVRRNSRLSFAQQKTGSRCYLGIHGGLNILPWLESYSTHLKVSAGGLNGKALKKGDMLSFGKGHYDVQVPNDKDFLIMPWSVNVHAAYAQPQTIAFLEGKEWDWLSQESKHEMVSADFRIDPSSDRMGSYLNHDPMQFVHQEELVSSAVSFGTIQALPSGQLVVLMADHQTTGGYPRIGHIVTAHLPKLSQLGSNAMFHLTKISIEDAEKMLFSLHQDLQQVQHACRERLDKYYAQH